MTTEACPERSAFRAASSIYRRCPFLPRPGFLSVRSRSPSRRAAGRGFRETTGRRGCPGGFCPSFVSSSNYDLPHEYKPYVNIRSPSTSHPSSTYSTVYPSLSSPSFCLSIFLSSAFNPPSLSLTLSPVPVTAERTSFRALWGCKCIRDDGRVLAE